MVKKDKIFEIERIIFESNDTSILMKGKLYEDYMNFASEMIVSSSHLNQLLNQLKRKNKDLDIDDLIIAETMFNGETLFTINLINLHNNYVNLNELTNQDYIKQIRA